MSSLEEHYYATGQRVDTQDISIMRKLDSLRALRHASRVLSLEDAVPTGGSWGWTKLLEDIDHLLVRIDPKAGDRHKCVKKESPMIDLTEQDNGSGAGDVKVKASSSSVASTAKSSSSC
ncbi:hypothetical protein PINS_up002915 [Pythium insidiosum]|nr:hypothetical protein PINS_up002915 [Pythium insidiosum]